MELGSFRAPKGWSKGIRTAVVRSLRMGTWRAGVWSRCHDSILRVSEPREQERNDAKEGYSRAHSWGALHRAEGNGIPEGNAE